MDSTLFRGIDLIVSRSDSISASSNGDGEEGVTKKSPVPIRNDRYRRSFASAVDEDEGDDEETRKKEKRKEKGASSMGSAATPFDRPRTKKAVEEQQQQQEGSSKSLMDTDESER